MVAASRGAFLLKGRVGAGKGQRLHVPHGQNGEDGPAFKVGSNSSFEARSGGALYLGINDELIDKNGDRVTDDGLGWRDNAGSFQARISVSARSGAERPEAQPEVARPKHLRQDR